MKLAVGPGDAEETLRECCANLFYFAYQVRRYTQYRSAALYKSALTRAKIEFKPKYNNNRLVGIAALADKETLTKLQLPSELLTAKYAGRARERAVRLTADIGGTAVDFVLCGKKEIRLIDAHGVRGSMARPHEYDIRYGNDVLELYESVAAGTVRLHFHTRAGCLDHDPNIPLRSSVVASKALWTHICTAQDLTWDETRELVADDLVYSVDSVFGYNDEYGSEVRHRVDGPAQAYMRKSPIGVHNIKYMLHGEEYKPDNFALMSV